MIDSAYSDHAIYTVGVAGFPDFFVVVEGWAPPFGIIDVISACQGIGQQHAIFVFLEGWTPLGHL